ncbi:right-handed parallel beta-helix repeat-containing protein [bacterium]|nr:right-handed parallel beta-helix repeat-containing protein [bacterium]
MTRRICLWVLLVLFSYAIALPIDYQGKLTDPTGVGINDTMDIALAIYDDPSAGTLIDADTVSASIVYHGLFSEIFDITIPVPAISGPLYIQIAIDTSMTGATWTALSPRQLVTTAFRAMWTDNAVNAIYADTATYVLASNVAYDNTASGLSATDVQLAIDELSGFDLQGAYDNGNAIIGDNSVSITLNPGHGRALYAKVGKDGISTSTAAAVYARNDSTGPAIYASGNIVQATGKYFGTNGDTRILLDMNNNSTDQFRIYSGDSIIQFFVTEEGLANANAIVANDSIELGGVWRNTWPTGGAVSDSNFIQNQDTVAQPAKFWIANRGVVGGVTSYSDVDMIFGSGTSGSSTKPFAGWYHYARNVSMITAAEIGAGGATTIDSLSIYLQTPSTTDPWTFDSVYIWLELTTATSVPTTWNVAGATQVYYVLAEAIPQVAGWYHFDITDFAYDGTSNLLIYFQDGYQSTNYASGGPQWRYSTMATSDYNAYDYDDSSWPTTLTTSTYRTDFRLSFTGFPSVIDQVVIENGTVDADNDLLIGGTSLTGTGGAGIVGYDNTTSGLAATDVQNAIDEIVGIAGGGKDTLWTVAEDPADTMVIMAQTKIYGELIADSIQAVGDTVYFDDNISVKCAKFGGGAVPSDTLLIEGFEGGTFPPTGWTQNYVIGTTDWTQSTTDAHSGSNSARFYYNTVTGDRTELITPVMNLSTYSSAFLEFWHYQNVWFGDQDSLEVYYSDDGGTSWNLLIGYYGDIPSWTFASIPLPSLSATYQIKFLGIEEWAHGVYLDDVFIYAPTGAPAPSAEICAGNINADGNLDIGGNATIGDTLEALHYRDSGGDNLLRSSDASVVIAEDLDGSWDLTVVGSGGPVPTLDQCYNSGSPGGGRTILATAGPVVMDATGATNGALNLFADDLASAALYINHGAIPPGNGIWNDANYWSPSGNIALGAGYYHTDNGLFQSNTDFICKIDANNDGNDTFLVQNSVGTNVFKVDEAGNTYIPGGINDGVGTGLAGMVLTADGAGHFNWAPPTGGGGFQQLRADGSAWLTDSVTLVAGTNITLTQTGDSITIDATGGAADNDWTRAGNLLTTYNITDSVGIGVAAPLYKLHVEGETNDDEAVGYFKNTSAAGSYIDGYGVYGECANDDYYGYGVYGKGGYVGVEGDVSPTGSDYYYGIYGYVDGGDGENYGVYGLSYGDGVNYGVYADAEDNGSGTSNNYGIYAYAAGGDTNWAAYLDGDVYVDAGIDLNGNGAVIGETYRDDWEQLNVITVGMGNADFTDLEVAINVANGLPGAIIKIAPGIYPITNSVPVLPTVVLRGSGQQNTIVIGALIDFNPNSEAYYIHFDNDINLAGIADGCWFTGNVQMLGGTAVARNCNFDDASGTNTVVIIEGGRIEQCDFNMAMSCEGDWTISDCKFTIAATIHPPSAGLTEVHIDGCDIFATISLTGASTFGYFESNKFSTGDGGAGVSISEDANAEIKANHFIDCIVGVDAGANTDVTVLSNNFISCFTHAILGIDCDRLDIIGNDVVGMGITSEGFHIVGLSTGIIKDNQIGACFGNGIFLDNMMDIVIDNNNCEGNLGNGIFINSGIYQILHNTLRYNGDGTTTFDLSDAGGGSIASYNVLDTYSPSGTGVWNGAFNTQSSGTIWPGGIQLGQLP